MNSFQKLVVNIAVFSLISLLIIVGIILYRSRKNVTYPPVTANCPDYWIDDGSSTNGSLCKNVKNLGKDSCKKEMNFSGSLWSGSRGLCNKSRWAKSCDLTWDGITSNNNICKI
jgi:hypothetical protein